MKRNAGRNELAFLSSRGMALRCPNCGYRSFELNMLKDGGQAYWCHCCESGWRIGELPQEAIYHRSDE